ncbi:MAG: Smr/MutS family protein [Beijerinckiaceae bacterium]
MKEAPPPTGYFRLRRLSDEEIELWLNVTRSVSPRPRAQPAHNVSMQADKIEEPVPAEPVLPQPAASPPPSLPNLAQLDRRMRQKLARGQAEVDAAIDLHGMRQQEAQRALHGFLQRCQRDGAKLVLVVTGKGEGRDEEGFGSPGVLRRSVPLWLRAPDWRSLVVGFEEASRQHGGAGALYVRLRRLDRATGKRRGLS